jgi:hypothetical protein
MQRRMWVFAAVLLGLFLSVFFSEAQAFYIDKKKTLQFSAKVQTRATFRLQDWEGYTYARASVGDLVQWRNLALIEVNHDLGELTNTLDILWPLKKLEIESRYHIVGRFMYDALYAVGSDKYKSKKHRQFQTGLRPVGGLC